MIEEVIKALARALNNALEEEEGEYTIYTENVEQGLKEPCFFIYCNGYKDELYRGKRYKISTDIIIEYIPEEGKEINRNVNNMLPRLYDITEMIEVEENLLRGLDRTVENTEGGVVFKVRYEYFYYKREEDVKMEILKQEGAVKNGN